MTLKPTSSRIVSSILFSTLCHFAHAQESHTQTITRFYNAKILLNHAITEGELWICQGEIIAPQAISELDVDLHGELIAPGYIDLQINGGFGCDFSINPEKIADVARLLPQYGVTAFLPTVITSTPERYREVLPWLQPQRFGHHGAEVLGIHLEGPYFSSSYFGAHNKEYLCCHEHSDTAKMTYGSLEGVKIVTLAPEIPGAAKLIEELKMSRIIVAAGHSGASTPQIQKGIECGIGFVTHLFNAMPSYHHRNPGIIGAALIQPSLPYSVIADGVHLCDETLSLCWRCNPKGLILVSDAIQALGLPNGQYQLGTMDIEVEEGKVYLTGTKTIAGSTLKLDQAVRNLRQTTQCSIVEALEAASLKPAQLLQIYPAKGSLEIGADADFLILNEDLEIKATYIGGKLYEKPVDD